MGDALRAGLTALFQSSRFSDMVIRFRLEHATVQPKKKQRTDSAQEEPGKAPIAFLGEPLPAHRTILCLSSGFISTRLESWQSAVEDGAQGDGSTPSTSGRPEVLVTLGSEAELPHALEVIRFMYTGQLTEGLGFEALLHVRRLAGYLEVADCLRACDSALLLWVNATGPCSSGSSGSSGDNGCNSRVLEAYRHHALLPDPETTPEPASFTPVLQALGGRLVQHLKDAVSVYTDRQLQQQWCALPACAVEAVLAADDFPTDCESTVLLLLACWLKHQSPPADPTTTERLCRLIRASRLSPTYASLVLPHLDWFPATKSELALIQLLVNAPDEAHRKRLHFHAQEISPVWAKAPKRKQLVAPEGRAVEWRVARSLLDQGLKESVQEQGTDEKCVLVQVQLSGPGVLPGGKQLLSCGLRWSCKLFATFKGAPESPELKLPLAFWDSASLPGEVSVPFTGALSCNLRWSLQSRWWRQVAWASSTSGTFVKGEFFTHAEVLPSSHAPGADPLGVLAGYMNDGALGGCITVHPAT